MARIKIVTDSTSDMPDQLAWESGISMMPLNVRFGEETFKDRVDMDSQAFFTRLSRSRVLPTTSMPSPQDFASVYDGLAPACDDIISIHISSKLSGTYQSAVTAARDVTGARVHVVDSMSVSAGLFIIALRAAESAARGAPVETLLADIERDIKKVTMYFVVDTLEYLQRGGRIGAAAQLIGIMLNVKPILTLRDGVIAAASRARSRRRAFDRVIELLAALPCKPSLAVVGHALVPDEAKKLDAMLREKFGGIRIYSCPIGPVIGTHSGPGCVEVAVI